MAAPPPQRPSWTPRTLAVGAALPSALRLLTRGDTAMRIANARISAVDQNPNLQAGGHKRLPEFSHSVGPFPEAPD